MIFAAVPAQALREIARVVRPSGRVLLSAWLPAGPIQGMFGALGRILSRVTQAPPTEQFGWSDAAAVRELARGVGLDLEATTASQLTIRAASPEAYVKAGQDEHPMGLAVRPVLQRAGVEAEATQAMTAVLHAANETSGALLLHSPYVVHVLRPTA